MTLDAQILNTATFIGIDCHPDSHTAVAMNRFKETRGHITFANTLIDIDKFMRWLAGIEEQGERVIIGIEGGGSARNALVLAILSEYSLLFEVNPLYTKHKRSFGTRGDKIDLDDAKLIAGVLTTELEELPRITPEQLTSPLLCLKKTIWFHDEVTMQGTRLQDGLTRLAWISHTSGVTARRYPAFESIINVLQEVGIEKRQNQSGVFIALADKVGEAIVPCFLDRKSEDPFFGLVCMHVQTYPEYVWSLMMLGIATSRASGALRAACGQRENVGVRPCSAWTDADVWTCRLTEVQTYRGEET